MKLILGSMAISELQLAVRLLRDTALTRIPDLEAAGSARMNQAGDDYDPDWVRDAEVHGRAALAWRDSVLARIGSLGSPNKHAPHPDWPFERLAKTLGHRRLRPVLDAHQPPGAPVDGREKFEPDPNWGPPESVLGELADPLPQTSENGDVLHYRGNDDVTDYSGFAFTYLGQPPAHLCQSPRPETLLAPPLGMAGPYRRGFKQLVLQGVIPNDYGRRPAEWQDYKEGILTQCLLVRARALELCAWCDERISAWEGAMYPRIEVGEEVLKTNSGKQGIGTSNYRLTVTIAGLVASDTSRTIQQQQAKYLRDLNTGAACGIPDGMIGKLKEAIPLLRGLIETAARDEITIPLPPLLSSFKRGYRFHPGMVGRVHGVENLPK